MKVQSQWDGYYVEIEEDYGRIDVLGPFRWRWVAVLVGWILEE